jgi:hypothetical protein
VKDNPVVVEESTETEYTGIKKEMEEAKKLYVEAIGMRTGDDHEAFKTKISEAKEYIAILQERLDVMLDPVRDENGQLPSDYGAYERDYTLLNTWYLDLYKVGGF